MRPLEADVVRRSVGPDGEKVSYLAAGDARAATGRTILLIHGSGVSARSWRAQLGGLGQGLRILAIDLPGHGESDPAPAATVEGYADAARGLLNALGTGPVFAVGHSLGGAVALALAARHPEAVRGLILLSTCAKLPEPEGSLGRVLYWYLPGPIRKVVFFWMAKKVLFAPGAPGGGIRLGMEEIRTCRPETILQDVTAARAMDLEEVARGLRVPTLIVCGSRDKLTPPALSERLHALVPDSQLHIVEGAGHMLPLEAPARVNETILDFIASVAPGPMRGVAGAGVGVRRPALRRLVDRATALFRRG